MTTRPPLGPGTEPLTSSRSRSASACDDGEVQGGDLLAAHAAGHARALEHPGRAWRRRRWSRGRGGCGGCRGRPLAAEAVALHDAGEALALADGGDVDAVAVGEQVDA